MVIHQAPDVPRLIVDQQRNLSELFPAVGGWTMVAEGDGFQLVASFPHPIADSFQSRQNASLAVIIASSLLRVRAPSEGVQGLRR